MFGKINLLSYGASTIEKYTTRLMEILFTQRERYEGYVIEGKSKSDRKPLDLERIDLLKSIKNKILIWEYFKLFLYIVEALFAKYSIPVKTQQETWSRMSNVAKRKCRDTTEPSAQDEAEEDVRRAKEQL
jgi:hypothetical protein